MTIVFETERLLVRNFRETDLEQLHVMGSDAEVARFTLVHHGFCNLA